MYSKIFEQLLSAIEMYAFPSPLELALSKTLFFHPKERNLCILIFLCQVMSKYVKVKLKLYRMLIYENQIRAISGMLDVDKEQIYIRISK